MITDSNNICALIPAAGRSSRMKSYKPMLLFDKNRTFIEKIIDEFLLFGCSKIVVIINEDIFNKWNNILSKLNSKVTIVINTKLELERFYSIKLGLKKIPNTENCFIHNSDNPFINQEILNKVYTNKKNDGYVSPTYNGRGGHPILISKPIIEKIINSSENNSNFRDIINKFPSKKIEINNKEILTNINTKSEYNKLIKF